MIFQDLPADWPTIPLTDPDHIADVLDIVVPIRDRMVGSLVMLFCDERRRPVQPVIINDVGAATPGDEHLPLQQIAAHFRGALPELTVLCAIARPGRCDVTGEDRRWARVLERAFAGNLELLGIHVITPEGTGPIAVEGAPAQSGPSGMRRAG